MESEERINEVKDRHSMELFNIPGVVGVGVERDDSGGFVLAVHVETDNPELLSQLPKQVEGYVVKVVTSGQYEKLSSKDQV
jgi:hypothetical protein